MDLETYFQQFRKNIIGVDTTYESPYGTQNIIYGDWIASGRLYKPIEDKISGLIGPFVANTHTEVSETGRRMTRAYHYSHSYIKKHCNAGPDDVIITAGFGMTAVINKLQRILGLKNQHANITDENQRPVVFLTHMEHHSNQTSWYETLADVVVLKPDENLLVDPHQLEKELQKYKDRTFKIGSFSACSNVTGIHTPYYELAEIMHNHGGLCFVDFAASAPYEDIDMHPKNPKQSLDAIFFSPHKFLGGPGSSGVLIFNKTMYHSQSPDNPGGGTVDWTNPWGRYKYVDDIETREDGGTPGFLQSIRAALSIKLKEQMQVEKILAREKELVELIFSELPTVPGIKLLAQNNTDRLGVISFYFENIHYNLVTQLLSDRFGIQVRGGCACAGTYGHFLLEVGHSISDHITELISHGDLSLKPGWIRWSIHPVTTNHEVHYFVDALKQIVKNIDKWKGDYTYNKHKNEFRNKKATDELFFSPEGWFEL